MCQVRIYQDEVAPENLLIEEVVEYELDLDERVLVARGFQGERRIDVPHRVLWRESNDVMVIT